MTEATIVTFLLDRTGSMEQIKGDTIGAFNAYLAGLRSEDAGVEFTLVQFDSIGLDKVCVGVAPKDAPDLNAKNYQPRASTPLIDAVFKTIKAVEKAVVGRDDKPKIVICIQTDGEENASTQHTWDELNALIKEKSDLGWSFSFMGAGIDAYKQGTRMGLSTAQTMSYDHLSAQATVASFAAEARNTMAFASGRSSTRMYSADQKLSAGDKFDPAFGGTSAQAPTAPPPHRAPRKPAAKRAIVDDFTL